MFVEICAVSEPVVHIVNVLNENVGGNKTILSQSYCRHQQRFPGQLAETLVRLPKTCNRAGNTRRLTTNQARVIDHVAIFVEIHILMCRQRRRLAIIEESCIAVHVDQHETTAAYVTGIEKSYGQRKPGRYCCIHGVATGTQDILADLCAVLVGYGNRSGSCDFCCCNAG